MIRNSTVVEMATTEPADLIPLAELAAEGFGWSGQYVRTPKDAVDALAAGLRGAVVLDDLGRRCTDRETARRLFAERAEAEDRLREQERRRAEESAKLQHSSPRGVPASEIPEGVDPAQWLMLNDPEFQKKHRRSVLEDALSNSGVIEYVPIREEAS